MTNYQKAILEAFMQVCEENLNKGIHGASATEVCQQMHKNQTISPLDSVIDIADQMKEMGERGWLVRALDARGIP